MKREQQAIEALKKDFEEEIINLIKQQLRYQNELSAKMAATKKEIEKLEAAKYGEHFSVLRDRLS